MKTPWLVGKGPTENEQLVVAFTSFGAVLLHVAVQGPAPKILHFSRVNIDSSLTENEKKNAFLEFLASLKVKKYPRVAVTWSDGMTFRQLNMPDMPAEDLEKAFAWDLKKKYYYDPEENHFGFNEVMDVDGAEGPEKLYNVFYCDKKAAALRLSFLQELGLEVRSLIPGQAALAGFAGQAVPSPENDVLVCEMDGPLVRILVVREDRNMLVRQVALGSHEFNFTDDILGKIAEEIKKTIDFYESQKYFRPVTKVVLTGLIEDIPRVHQFLSERVGTSVVLPDIEPYISDTLKEEDKNYLKDHNGLFASALGAVLAHEENMNLVPEDIKSLNRQRRTDRWLNLTLAGTGFLMFLVVAATMGTVHFMKGQMKTLEKEFGAVNEKKQIFENILGMERVRREVFKGEIYSPSLLKELSYRTPQMITLTEMQYDRQEVTLVLRGEISSAQRDNAKSVAQYAASLAESPFFTAATVTNSNPDDENKVLRFEIHCNVRGLL